METSRRARFRGSAAASNGAPGGGCAWSLRFWPDSPNNPHFPQAVLRPGEVYPPDHRVPLPASHRALRLVLDQPLTFPWLEGPLEGGNGVTSMLKMDTGRRRAAHRGDRGFLWPGALMTPPPDDLDLGREKATEAAIYNVQIAATDRPRSFKAALHSWVATLRLADGSPGGGRTGHCRGRHAPATATACPPRPRRQAIRARGDTSSKACGSTWPAGGS